LDVDGHVRREEREAIGARDAGQRKCGEPGEGREREQPDEETATPRPRSGRLQGSSRDRSLREQIPVLRS